VSEYERVWDYLDDTSRLTSPYVNVYLGDEDGQAAAAVRAWAVERGRVVRENVDASALHEGKVVDVVSVDVRPGTTVTVMSQARPVRAMKGAA
jgi:hypothetical protein